MAGFIIKSKEMLKHKLLSSSALTVCIQQMTCIACLYKTKHFILLLSSSLLKDFDYRHADNSQQPFKILFKDEKKKFFLCFLHANLGIFDKFALENDTKQRVPLCTRE